jgi:hypothetical protein
MFSSNQANKPTQLWVRIEELLSRRHGLRKKDILALMVKDELKWLSTLNIGHTLAVKLVN